MQQQNLSAPDAQSVHIVTMEVVCMSVAVPHIPGDGRLDTYTLLDNQLDSGECQLGDLFNSLSNYRLHSAHQIPAQLYQPAWGQ